MKLILPWSLILAATGMAQTQLDLRTQSRNVDFSNATTTKSVKTGTVLPASCGTGEIFLHLNAPGGPTLYLCASANLWSAAGGVGDGTMTAIKTATAGSLPAACNIGDVRFVTDSTVVGGGTYFYFCTALDTWTQSGYVSGGSGALAANCSAQPCTIDITSSVPLKTGANAWLGANDYSGASKTAPFRIAGSDPLVCDSVSREFYLNTTTNVLKACVGPNTWVPVGAISGPALSTGQGYYAPYGFPAGNSTAVNWNTESTGAFVCTQFVAPYAMTLNKVGVILGTGPGAGKGLVVGYMDSNLNTLVQGTLVAPAGGDNAVVSFGSSLSLTPGIYYQCVGSEDIGVTLVPALSGSAATGFSSTLNNGSSKRVVVCTNAPSGSGANYALPASCGTASAKNYPIVASVLLP